MLQRVPAHRQGGQLGNHRAAGRRASLELARNRLCVPTVASAAVGFSWGRAGRLVKSALPAQSAGIEFSTRDWPRRRPRVARFDLPSPDDAISRTIAIRGTVGVAGEFEEFHCIMSRTHLMFFRPHGSCVITGVRFARPINVEKPSWTSRIKRLNANR
jgi:hypothetical protein